MSSQPSILRRLVDFVRLGNSPALVLFCALFTYGLLYRARLILRTAQEGTLKQEGLELSVLFPHVGRELFFALGVSLIAWLGWRIFVFARERLPRLESPGKWLGLIVLHVFLIAAAFLYATHYRLFFSLRSGLTYDMLSEVIAANSFFAMSGDVNPQDYLFWALAILVYWIYRLMPPRLIPLRNLSMIAFAGVVLVLASTGPGAAVVRELRENPVMYTLRDFALELGRDDDNTGSKLNAESRRKSPGNSPGGVGGPAGDSVVGLRYSDYGNAGVPARSAPLRTPDKKWNILYIIMESTGAEYIFSTKHGNRMPMPFLRSIADKSLYMTDHFSPANTSPRSLFSIFTGVYPAPRVRMFVTRPRVRIPSIINFLGPGHESFLVTPGGLNWFFPKGFFKNSGMRLYGYDDMGKRRWGPSPSNGRNEIQTADFFLKRLKKTKDPFVAVYYSYIAHWPYFNYGRKYDVFHPAKPRIHRWEYRYYNNLRLMDTLIKRMFDQLEASGRLKDTIVVITGDHGQAFGKHKGNWIHSRASFNENYRVPLIVYQPRLFAPRTVTRRTLHIDIMPTLLDAMGIAYNPRLLQGESLLRNEPKRKYDFLYGNERTISSISRAGVKMQVSLKRRTCWVFDLAVDPDERRKLGCAAYAEQRRVLDAYRLRQNEVLKKYNSDLAAGRAFQGQKHPPGGSP